MFTAKGPGGQDKYLVTVESHELFTAKGPGGQDEYLVTVESHELFTAKGLVDKTNTWSQLSHINCLQLKDWWTRRIPGHS